MYLCETFFIFRNEQFLVPYSSTNWFNGSGSKVTPQTLTATFCASFLEFSDISVMWTETRAALHVGLNRLISHISMQTNRQQPSRPSDMSSVALISKECEVWVELSGMLFKPWQLFVSPSTTLRLSTQSTGLSWETGFNRTTRPGR